VTNSSVTTDISASAYAEKLNFLVQEPPPTENAPRLKYPEKTGDIELSLYLVCKKSSSNSEPSDTDYITFDDEEHIFPDVLYLDPYDYSPSKLAFTIINGLCIETEEIDGFTIPQPSLDTSLSTENSFFLNSALPLNKIITARINGSSTPTSLLIRQTPRQDSPAIGVSLYDYSTNRLPYFTTDVCENVPTTGLLGFNSTKNVSRFTRAYTYFGFTQPRLGSNTSPNIRDHTIYAWSSYRYINPHLPSSSAHLTKVSMILNFRTTYGTNITLSKSANPALLIPRA
jgi:hypothetical protein